MATRGVGQGAESPRQGRKAAAVPRLRPRVGRIGPLSLQQLVLLEVAAALLLVAWVVNALLLVPAAVVAAGLVLFALVRRHRRPVPEWLATAIALRGRKRRAERVRVPAGIDPGFAPAVECDPSLRTYAYTPTQGERRPVGMVGDGTFLTAVLQVQAKDTPLRPGRVAHPLPLDVLYDGLEVDGISLESVQVVQHTQPAPAPHLPEHAAAARSYVALQAQSGAPAVRLTWVALKLDPELCPEAVQARGGGLAGAQRALLRIADQLVSRLAGAGFEARVLSEGELIAAVATSACANPRANAHAERVDAPARRTAETGRAWQCDDRWHTSYWIGRWPPVGPGATPAPNLVALLTSMPALVSTFAVTMARGTGDAPALTGYVRITGRSDS